VSLLCILTLFILHIVFRLNLGAAIKTVLLTLAGALVTYGIVLTVIPKVWVPFTATFGMPKWGWPGVFKIAIVFDLIAAVLAFFVLRKMKAPVKQGAAGAAAEPRISGAAG